MKHGRQMTANPQSSAPDPQPGLAHSLQSNQIWYKIPSAHFTAPITT